MVNKLLLIHQQYRPDDQVIWRVAIRNGWKTYRVSKERQYDVDAPTGDIIRYYGNMLDEPKMLSYGIRPKRIPDGYLEKIPECLTRRKIYHTTFGELDDILKEDLFVKCTNIKWFPAQVYKKGETIIGCTKNTDTIYVQEPVKFTQEYRCFCLDGKILTASQYKAQGIDNGNIDNNDWFHGRLSTFVETIHYMNILPNAVVMDFGFIEGRGLAFIEANEAWAAGLYDSNPEEAFKVIIESQTND